MHRSSLALALVPALVLALAPVALRADDSPPEGLAFRKGHHVGSLADTAIQESSGIAASCSIANAFWTHNDSGDEPRLFLFDRAGGALARFHVEGAKARDWEDVATFVHDGRCWIVVADTGDNSSKRDHVVLYLIEEPTALPSSGEPGTLPVKRALRVRWEGGPIDCESVGVDVPSGQVLLVTKVRKGGESPSVHVVPLEALVGSSGAKDTVETKKIATLPNVPKLTTAADVSPDGRRLVVCTYGDAYGWARGETETWAHALEKAPVRIELPKRKQGESICFDREGKVLYLTSEGSPCPLIEVRPR